MAGQNIIKPYRATGVKPVMLAFSVHPNGTVTVSSSTYIKGRGVAQMTRDDTGVFTVTMQDQWYRMHPTIGRAYASAGAAAQAQVTKVGDIARGVTASSYITFTWKVTSTATDVNYSTSDFFVFHVHCEASGADED
jgi:hypothetical protein